MTLTQIQRLLVAAAIAMLSCREPPGETPPEPTILGTEDIAVVQRELIETGPRIAGSLEARDRAAVRAEVAGSVLSVGAEIGETVDRGQVIARLESRTLREAVASAQAAVRSAAQQRTLAERELSRTRALVEGGALAERELETARNALVAAEAQLDDARSQLATARAQLADATVRSPISGVVSERAVSQGDVVAQGAELFTIIEPSSMRLEASVPSEALGVLDVGTPVHFRVRGYPDTTFTGRIARVGPAADEVTRQIPILVDIPNPRGDLVAGLFAEGRVVAATHQALVIPERALIETGTAPTVARVSAGEVEHVQVKLGLRDEQDQQVAVVSGLALGDVVLVRGGRDLPPGTPVVLPETQKPATDTTPPQASAAAGEPALSPVEKLR